MKTAKNITMIVAAAMIAVGLFGGLVVLATMNFDFKDLNNIEWETNTYAVEEKFENISIKGDEAGVSLALSEDGSCKVVCTEAEHVYNVIGVKNKTLSIERVDERKWNEYIGIFINEIELTVYLPKADYEKLTINNSSGSVEIPAGFTFSEAEVVNSSGHISFAADVKGDLTVENTSGGIDIASVLAGRNMDVKGTSGSIDVSDVKCVNLTVENSSGRVDCENVIAAEEIFIKNSSGGIELEKCDASNLKLKATSGSIKGTLLSEKTFLADASSGRVDVPRTTTGGVCEVTTSSGNISMSIVE